MGSPIYLLDKFKTLWTVWDLRGAVLLSLFFQVLLIFIASSRKRIGRITVTFFLWSAYLLVDWVATFAIGLIASGPSDYGKKTLNDDLNAFWASFLLGHLGGPHTITAFALEDNELWIRHMLQLIIHLLAIAYVFYQSLPNQLWVPISLVYLAGLIKYVERTRALYLASLGTMKTSMLPPPRAGSNYARLMQTYRSKQDAFIPVGIIFQDAPAVEPPVVKGEKSTEIGVVQNGWRFFNMFKGLVVDIIYGYGDWQETRQFFFEKKAIEAYKIMEIELNFLYDLLYTKMLVVQCKMGLLFRFICLACVVVALERFQTYQQHLKLDIDDHDINITYTLLIGAISLDVVAFIMLAFSDWTIASLSDRPIEALKCCNYTKLLKVSYEKFLATTRKNRWSQCVSQYSLMDYCLNLQFKVMNDAFYLLGAKDSFDELKYKKIEVVQDNMKEFIFKELKDKAVKAMNSKEAKEICSWRGEKVLLEAPQFYTSLVDSVQVEYDESVLRWHVATELLYYTTRDEKDKDENRRYCKIMSQYMLYLMIMRPTMMSAVTSIVQIRFQDTCEETKKFFLSAEKTHRGFTKKLKDAYREAKNFFCSVESLTTKILKIHHGFTKKVKDAYGKAKNFLCLGSVETSKAIKEEEDEAMMEDLEKACKKLLAVDTVVAPDKVKAGTSRSVLFDACIMAKDLRKMEAKDRWKIMSGVWVELLSYAASHCRAYAHAQQLSKGGEFITFVWLLMIHFGFGEQFRVDHESRMLGRLLSEKKN